MFDSLFLVCAFAGGIVGAALGGMPMFILCGVAAVIGAGVNLATGAPTFLNVVAWGPFLGPHVAFAGGVAAAAYAHRKGKLSSGRDIAVALMGLDAPDVLLVGGMFGALGYLLKVLLDLIPNIGSAPWTNTIAMSIVVNTILARVIFGKTGVFGTVRQGDSRWVPTEVAAWLPWQSKPTQLIVIAIGVALPIAYAVVQEPTLLGVGFGLTVLSLIFLQIGIKAPVTFHIALSAEAVAAATGNIWWGLAFGVLAAFLGELYACLFLYHGDTHVDPPSATVSTMFMLQAVLAATGVLGLSGMMPLVVAAIVALLGYLLLNSLRGKIAVAKISVQRVVGKPSF